MSICESGLRFYCERPDFSGRNRSRILTDALVNGRAEPEDRRSERLMVGQNAIAQEVSGARLGAAAP
ncbi:MAG TPA: hypothetical protein VMV10_12145, partial [Pirellulales bacterium]|nr:hypothetical protein [Pirellulales bacterium]